MVQTKGDEREALGDATRQAVRTGWMISRRHRLTLVRMSGVPVNRTWRHWFGNRSARTHRRRR
jgi:hypothetical protein